jgi:tetratricopeptide (TPR) repeat protein
MNPTPEVPQLVEQAKQCLQSRKFDEAISLFRQAIAQDEFNVKLHESLVSAYILAKEYALATEQLERILRIAPTNVNAMINLGAMYNKVGRHSEAAVILRKAIAKDKNSCHGYYNLGIAQRHLNDLVMAAWAYREAIRIDPKMADAHQNLGNVLLEMGQVKQAIQHYESALKINPEFRAAQRGLERAKDEQDKAKQAINPFGRLVDESMVQGGSRPLTNRELTDVERLKDRSTINKLTQSIDLAATALVEFLKHDLEKVLSSLNRSIAQEAVSPGSISRAYEDYQSALTRCNSLRRALKRKMLELRAHEELICTPDLLVEDERQ